jgi:hypothetical protein
MSRPKKLKTELEEGTEKKVGAKIEVDIDGEAGDGSPDEGERHHRVLVRVFYRVNGIPYQIFFLQKAKEKDNGGKKFTATKPIVFRPQTPGTRTLKLFAWDNRSKEHRPKDVENGVKMFPNGKALSIIVKR